jgi:tetratricopeptide (TPR) repeat protein
MHRSETAITAALLLLPFFMLAALSDPQALPKAQEAFKRQDWAASEKECLAELQEEPQNAGAHKLLGMVYAAQQKFKQTETPLRRSCELNPNDNLVCYYLGRNYFAPSRYEESRAVLEQALRAHPNSTRIQTGLGLTLEALGKAGEAERYLKEGTRGNSSEALSEYGQLLFRQGRLAESVAILKRSENTLALNRATSQQAAQPTRAVSSKTPAPARLEEGDACSKEAVPQSG